MLCNVIIVILLIIFVIILLQGGGGGGLGGGGVRVGEVGFMWTLHHGEQHVQLVVLAVARFLKDFCVRLGEGGVRVAMLAAVVSAEVAGLKVLVSNGIGAKLANKLFGKAS